MPRNIRRTSENFRANMACLREADQRLDGAEAFERQLVYYRAVIALADYVEASTFRDCIEHSLPKPKGGPDA